MSFDINTARNFALMMIPGAQPFAGLAQIIPDSIRNFPFNLFSFGLPRGEGQKFRRTVFPAMLAKAQAEDGITAGLWFGDLTLVRADGSIDVIANDMHSLSTAFSALRTLADRMGQTIFVFKCPAGIDFEVPSQVSSRCGFDAFHPRLDPSPTAVDLVPDPAPPDRPTQEISLSVVSPAPTAAAAPIQAGFTGSGVLWLVLLGFVGLFFAVRE